MVVRQCTTAFENISPLTTKGDLLVRTTTANVRLLEGPDNQVLSTDSTTPEGLKWALQDSFFSFIELTGTVQAMANNNGYITNNPHCVIGRRSCEDRWKRRKGMENRPECRANHSLRQSRYDERHRRLFGFDESKGSLIKRPWGKLLFIASSKPSSTSDLRTLSTVLTLR
ncbi:MAG: hypothetical protein WCG14_06075 [Chlamydiia bacterium]